MGHVRVKIKIANPARRDQPIEHHRATEPLHRFRQPAFTQNPIELEPPPELIADMDRPGLAMSLGRYPRRIDFDQSAAGVG